jgi:hypothetical protein
MKIATGRSTQGLELVEMNENLPATGVRVVDASGVSQVIRDA